MFLAAMMLLQGCASSYLIAKKAGCRGAGCGDMIFYRNQRDLIDYDGKIVYKTDLLRSLDAAGYREDVARVHKRQWSYWGPLAALFVTFLTAQVMGGIADDTYPAKSEELTRANDNARAAGVILGAAVLLGSGVLAHQGQSMDALIKRFNARDMRELPTLKIIELGPGEI